MSAGLTEVQSLRLEVVGMIIGWGEALTADESLDLARWIVDGDPGPELEPVTLPAAPAVGTRATPEQLDAAPIGQEVRDYDQDCWTKEADGRWRYGDNLRYSAEHIFGTWSPLTFA